MRSADEFLTHRAHRVNLRMLTVRWGVDLSRCLPVDSQDWGGDEQSRLSVRAGGVQVLPLILVGGWGELSLLLVSVWNVCIK